MGDLTRNFSRSEFECKCGCGFNTVDPVLARAVQALRDSFGLPMEILSGCRCIAHNGAVGGEAKSMHLFGKAADIRIAGVRPRVVFAEAWRVREFGGFGLDEERGFLHVDVRIGARVRWCYHQGRTVAWFEGCANG